MMDEAEGHELTVPFLVQRVLVVNMSAIHTTSQSLTFALYRLAANPEWIVPMREEVQSVVKAEGWSKIGMQKMHHIDSFLKECQRCDGLGTRTSTFFALSQNTLILIPLLMTSVVMTRVALKNHTFSDGTYIPKGTYVAAAVTPMHHDDEYYPNADVFDPWRFANLRDGEGESLKHQLVSTNKEYIVFGHGKDAW